jgi:hypothetical protein
MEMMMSTTNRRSFLGGTAIAAATVAAGVGTERLAAQEPAGKPIIAYRDLGSTGFKVSEIGMGCMNMRDPELVRAAIDSGINYLDTAYMYQNGQNEEVIGQVMKTERNRVFLTTKVGRNSGMNQVPGEIETSLKRLQTDHVDLLLLHHGGDTVELVRDNTRMKALDDARRKGQTRFVGVSTHTADPATFDALIATKFYDAVLLCYNYLSTKELTESIVKLRKAGIAVIAMKTLLNVNTTSREPLPDIREDKNGPTTYKQALLKWVLANKSVDTVIPGMTAFEHLTENLAIMGTKLTSNDRALLRQYTADNSDNRCLHLAGCTGCDGQCPKGVPICEFNRCLAYAHSYGDMRLAWENYLQLPRSARIDRCSDCGECVVTCAHGLDLTATVRRARELFA